MSTLDFDKLAQYATIPDDAVALLNKPERQTRINLNIRLEHGDLIVGDLFLVIYNTARGPAKGGIRFQPDVNMEETADLAERMVWKTALMNIPFGGGKSGIALDPKNLNRLQKATVFREYCHLLRNELMRGQYIPAPDMGTTQWEMAVIFGETHVYESVTGKPPRVGGLPGRLEATGRGLATCVSSAAREFLGRDKGELRVAIQGFGNVGSWTARFLEEFGVRVVAVSDVAGGVYNEQGLPINDICMRGAEGAHALNGADGDRITNEELLALDVDVLVPAATGHVLTDEVAGKVRAKMIVEGANGPTTPEGDDVLGDRGIIVVPDILANSGGVIASYIEWRKAKSGSLTRREETFEVIDDLIRDGFARVLATAKENKIAPRLAAEVLAVKEVVGSMQDRGWV